MVAMDFFTALNCYDFLNQYRSNLLKYPTVRGLSVKQTSHPKSAKQLVANMRVIDL